MQSETGFPSSHQLKSYVASKFRLKLVARCPVSLLIQLTICQLTQNHINISCPITHNKRYWNSWSNIHM